jgi:tetratricopeptide (TPR) repeat protein
MLAEAVMMYRRAIALNPSYAHAWRGLAELLQAIDQSGEALAAWRRWSALVRNKAEASSELGWALARARRWDEAEIELAQAVAQEGAEYRADTRLAYVRRERGDVEGALSAYRRGCARSPAALTPRFGAALGEREEVVSANPRA